MTERITFSGQHLGIENIASHVADVETALRRYFFEVRSQSLTFIGYTREKLAMELEQRIEEEEKLASLSILAALEAAFRIDFLQRVYLMKEDNPIGLYTDDIGNNNLVPAMILMESIL